MRHEDRAREDRARADDGHDASTPREIQREVESLRDELDGLVGELDRRRHEAFDVRLQLRRHARALAIGGGAIAVALLVRRQVRRRRQDEWAWRISTLARTASRIVERPDRLEQAVDGRAGSAVRSALATGAGLLVRSLLRPTP